MVRRVPVTPNEISSAALAVAVVSAAFAGVSAAASRRAAKAAAQSATAGESSVGIDAAREQRATRPRLSGYVAFVNERSRALTITLESAEALTALEVWLPQEQGACFVRGAPGVHDPQPGEPAPCRASAFDSHAGKPAALRPRQSVTWPLTVSFDRGREVLRMEADCRGEHGRHWPAVLVEAAIEPDPSTTVW
jgi:hypothetical protein